MEATTVDNNTVSVANDATAQPKTETITIEGIELSQVVIEPQERQRAQMVNNSLMKIQLLPLQFEAHFCNMGECLNGMRSCFYSRPSAQDFQDNRVHNVKWHLSKFLAWHKETLMSVYYSEYTFHQHAGRVLWGHKIETARKCEQLFTETAKLIHELQHPTENPQRYMDGLPLPRRPLPPLAFSDREVERAFAEYALYLAFYTRASLGPVSDRRYRHKDKPKWARIQARALEHLRLVVLKDVNDNVDGDEGVKRNKELAAQLKKAALQARAQAAQAEIEKLDFAAEEAAYDQQRAQWKERLAS